MVQIGLAEQWLRMLLQGLGGCLDMGCSWERGEGFTPRAAALSDPAELADWAHSFQAEFSALLLNALSTNEGYGFPSEPVEMSYG